MPCARSSEQYIAYYLCELYVPVTKLLLTVDVLLPAAHSLCHCHLLAGEFMELKIKFIYPFPCSKVKTVLLYDHDHKLFFKNQSHDVQDKIISEAFPFFAIYILTTVLYYLRFRAQRMQILLYVGFSRVCSLP